jgi:hypothetical protein
MTVPAGDPANPAAAVVDGVDLDAVALAVRGCAAVDDLCAGAWGGVAKVLDGDLDLSPYLSRRRDSR